MLSPETFENALASYETGVQRIEQDSLSMGVTYLDRSIPVFQEHGDLRRLTHARHYKLFAYLRDERYEEVESLYAQVLQGYV
ncbi:MAG: hypothetical protein GWO16_00150, partial [Gammaproteobacteria bacterium]|nr:hypothetical protein [Gammaproteobacteria bacterium]NIR96527.1 hypothetical protein [Gammaproteobacteria bacterium]NIT62265.1 hypothetical protein [Gammaproteobacteria bacterium]NIV19116.1 hypothetical protein [Gammaproteobacteria bacterium]NIX10042.1 hypothetical protein [Gammaproteobacteria bacterium]